MPASRSAALCSPPPRPLPARWGGRGWGVFLHATLVDRNPPPPTPPRRCAGGGEKSAAVRRRKLHQSRQKSPPGLARAGGRDQQRRAVVARFCQQRQLMLAAATSRARRTSGWKWSGSRAIGRVDRGSMRRNNRVLAPVSSKLSRHCEAAPKQSRAKPVGMTSSRAASGQISRGPGGRNARTDGLTPSPPFRKSANPCRRRSRYGASSSANSRRACS